MNAFMPSPYQMAIDPDILHLHGIYQKNKNLNFVQRLLYPQIYPNMLMPEGPGTYGTHLMSSGEYQGKGIAYPEIIQDPESGKLIRLGRDEARDYAVNNGEYIQFDTPTEAEWFGQNYKKYLGIY
jgi:hypothetical protein